MELATGMMRFLQKYWFLVGLASAMVLGHTFANPLQGVSEMSWLRNSVVMTVMFLMALPLPLATIVETIKRPWAAFLASIINFGLFPLVAWGIAILVDPTVRTGFLVVAATPCTLASAAVWTRRANGNDVTALMTTVITNTLSFVATPLIVFVLIRGSAEVQFTDMVIKLGMLVLLPMLFAQIVAARQSIGRWAARHKSRLSIAAQSGILIVVLLGTAQTMLKMTPDQIPDGLTLIGLILVCCVLHCIVLTIGFFSSKAMGFSRANQIAVAFSGSQKTLMIGLLVCIQLNVSLLPMVIYHASQLTIDTFVADKFRRRMKAEIPGNSSEPGQKSGG